MAVYNGVSYLREQIDSILNQDYLDWELLISDDCSTDGSLDVIREYCARDSRIRLVLDEEHYGGAKKHFMALLRLADAPYVMTCDQDDVWDKNKVSLTLDCMRAQEKETSPVLVCTDLRVVNESLELLSPSFLEYSGMDASCLGLGYFLASCLVTGCTMMVNRPLLELLQVPVDEDKLIMHDWWGSLLASAFGTVFYLNQTTISYRQHGNNSVGAEHFTVAGALAGLQQKRRTELAALEQASELYRVFADKLDSFQKQQVEAFLAIKDASPLRRVELLGKADAWRHGILRNAGTLFTFMTLKSGR